MRCTMFILINLIETCVTEKRKADSATNEVDKELTKKKGTTCVECVAYCLSSFI